jgi:lysophospholipase L1-like esterase
MSIRHLIALCLVLSLFHTARGESPFNPSKEKWPTSAGGPQQAQVLKLKNLPVGKLLVLGNSITAHGPKPDIGWTGDWGMAASAADKDFVHVLAAQLGKAAGGQVKFMARNIADFERGHAGYDIAERMKDELALKPDVVVLAIGENVPALETDEAKAKYAEAFGRLLTALEANSHPAIFVRGCFWANPPKDEIMKRVAEEHGVVYVDVGALGRDAANAARSERKIEHDGVAGHPGDRGMQAIADALFAAIEKKADAKE